MTAATYYEVITVATGNTLAVFDTREEADAAASEYDHEVTVVGFNKDGLAQESPAATKLDEPFYEIVVDLETYRKLERIAHILDIDVEEAVERVVKAWLP